MCSLAMVWGMNYKDFWHCSWAEYFTYLRKYQLENEKRDNEFDYMAWWQGQYFAAALMSVYPLFNSIADHKKSPKYPYPSRPYSTQKPESQKDREKLQRTKSLIQEHNLIIGAKIKNKLRASGASSE